MVMLLIFSVIILNYLITCYRLFTHPYRSEGTLAVVLGLHLMNQREKLPADVLFCQLPGVLVNLNQISTPLLLSIATIERIIAIAFPVKLVSTFDLFSGVRKWANV